MLTKTTCGSLCKKARKIVGPVIKISTEMKRQESQLKPPALGPICKVKNPAVIV